MSELEFESGVTHEIIIKSGLKAYPLPDLGEDGNVPSIEEAKQRLDGILDSIKMQGGELIGVMPLEVAFDRRSGVFRSSEEGKIKSFLIINNKA